MQEYFYPFGYTLLYDETFQELSVPPYAFLIAYSSIVQDKGLLVKLSAYEVPLLVIHSVKEEGCIQALEAGADDFLFTPLHPREVHARINAVIRRIQGGRAKEDIPKEVLFFGSWKLYLGARRVLDRDNQELFISAGEYALLLAFLRKPQQVLTREELLVAIKQGSCPPINRQVDIQISRLRQKLQEKGEKKSLIRTIRNVGYLFTVPVILGTST